MRQALKRLTRTTPAVRAANLLLRDSMAMGLAEALTYRNPELEPGSARLVATIAVAAANAASAAWSKGEGKFVGYLDAAFTDVIRLCATGVSLKPTTG